MNMCPIPQGLESRVILELRNRERGREKTRVVVFLTLSFASLAALVPAFENVKNVASRSGFTQYASLIFSDLPTIAGMWKLFALSLAETAPIFALAISAAVLLAFVWSAAQAFRYVKAMKLSFS